MNTIYINNSKNKTVKNIILVICILPWKYRGIKSSDFNTRTLELCCKKNSTQKKL